MTCAQILCRAVTMTSWASLCALLLIAPPSALADDGTYATRVTQYVFVIDDSASMRGPTRDGPAADPDRLTILATQSLLSALDDRDEATVVRLNGPQQAEASPPLMPLVDNRQRLESMLSLTETIAAYKGAETPCRSALDATKSLLNAAYRPGVPQVVILMTDGACSPPDVVPDEFLRGLKSHELANFQFYLLRWRGRSFSRSLLEIADRTGGIAVEVGATDPYELLQPLASVLSRSQGYESFMLTPKTTTMAAHVGARRIRLLAVAPDLGEDLAFSFEGTEGEPAPPLLGEVRRGMHQFEAARKYRFAAVDYQPGKAPVRVSLSGAGPEYRIVAIPEYKLHTRMTLREGRCGENGRETQVVDVGASACATLELVNEDGVLVSSVVAGPSTRASVAYKGPGTDTASSLPATRKDDSPVFLLERVNLTEGDHVFTPEITLGLGASDKSGVRHMGSPQTLQVSTMRIGMEPARFEFGDLLPGTEQHHTLKISGNFPVSQGRLNVPTRSDIPSCLTFELSGKSEGQAQAISPGQTYSLDVKVASYCGPNVFRKELDSSLVLDFDRVALAAQVPSLVIPFRAALVNDLKVPQVLSVELESGETRDMSLVVEGSFAKEVAFDAIVPEVDEREGWPREKLELFFLDDAGREVLEGELLATHRSVTFGRASDGRVTPLKLRVRSDACCDASVYRTELALVATGQKAPPVRIPVEITVKSAGAWKCYGSTILQVACIALIGLLLLYVYLMFRNTHLIDRQRLGTKLIPLRLSEYGEPEERPNGRSAVQTAIRNQLTLARRVRAWVRANPLVFGLPGKSYREAVRIQLPPAGGNINNIQLEFFGRRSLDEAIAKAPSSFARQLFAEGSGIRFLGMPHQGTIAGYSIDGYEAPEADDQATRVRSVGLNNKVLLSNNPDRDPAELAGWKLT
jgi:hypothetical protein